MINWRRLTQNYFLLNKVHIGNMSETLSFEAPKKLVKAAKLICELYAYPIESFLVDALRSEIDRNALDHFDELSFTGRKDFSKQVLSIIGD